MLAARTLTLAAVVAASTALALAGCSRAGETAPTSPEPPVTSGATPAAEPSATPAATPEATAPSAATGASALDVARVTDDQGRSSTVVTLPLDTWEVRVDWPQDPRGTDLGEYIEAHPGVAMVTNAGIFSEDGSPGGLLVSDGEELHPLNLADGWGNFHLKPNAVFAVLDDGTAQVVESSTYSGDGVLFATQSGPALLLDGQVHPQFREGSENVAIRNGVGVSPDGRTVYIVMSRTFVNLWDFAEVFRELGCEDALYLDGQISQLWVEGRPEPSPYLGPYSGVVAAFPR
ncbi:phosphodiester glycosidase family protein [Demequina pelophila]|uniref:phosphodiester glycosidase family protein n=1 Tax=Demequina pelophila TaxID=1638984 RepID=UPI000784FE58|nr:phosphodiester glycosidase family protein [Demequina pelophila]